jgi:membrane-bound serine protease (ClpP class)
MKLCSANWVLVLCLFFLVSHAQGQEQARSGSANRFAIVLDIEGAIGPATTEHLRQGFEAAAERDAALMILRIDTPGGLGSSMREIIQDILASPIPVITYVSPSGARAASAGTYILYASHLAVMAPGTNLGAATPISLGRGSQPLDGDSAEESEGDEAQVPADASTAKAVNDAVAYIQGLAEIQGRNADWAEEAVRQAASLSAAGALDAEVIEIIATDLDDLLAQADGRNVQLGGQAVTLQTSGLQIVTMEPDWRARVLSVITNPNIAYILLLIGVYGVIFEVISPGAIFPGVIGATALLVGLFALNLLPINYAGAGLLLLGIALMAGEAFVPSFGALGIGGAVAFALGSLFMFDEVPGFELSLSVVLTATAASVALLAIMLAAVVRAHRRKVVSGEPAMIGSTGEVLSWSGERGQIHVHGERWQARSAEPLAPGERVRVTAREELTLMVEPVKPPPLPEGEPAT